MAGVTNADDSKAADNEGAQVKDQKKAGLEGRKAKVSASLVTVLPIWLPLTAIVRSSPAKQL